MKRARAAAVMIAALMLALLSFGCKARDWRSRMSADFDRPIPAWAETLPNEPGANWFAVGRVQFDTPSGRFRAPSMAEMQARQKLARDIRTSAEAAAEVLISTLHNHPPANHGNDAHVDEAEFLKGMARDCAERVVQRIGHCARVVDEWLDTDAREYFVLILIPFRLVRIFIFDEIRREWPAAETALLPAAIVQALLIAKQRQRRFVPWSAAKANAVDPALNWPADEPNEPGRTFFAGVKMYRPTADIDPDPVIDVARLRLADRIAGVVEPVLAEFFTHHDWLEPRRRGERVMATDLAVNVACGLAARATVLTFALDPPDASRGPNLSASAKPTPLALPEREVLAWYAPRQTRPRPSRVLVAVQAAEVTAQIVRWLQRLVGPFSTAETESIALELSARLADEQARQFGSRGFSLAAMR